MLTKPRYSCFQVGWTIQTTNLTFRHLLRELVFSATLKSLTRAMISVVATRLGNYTAVAENELVILC